MAISDFLADHSGVFDDSPSFASDVLIPALRAELNISLISPFIPSYVFELVKVMAENPSIASRVTLTLVVQRRVTDTNLEEVIEAAIQRFIFKPDEKSVLTQSLGELVRSGVLDLRLVLSSPDKSLSTTCKGLITPTNPLDRRFIAFHDELPGDFNSPIHLWASWVENHSVHAKTVKDLQFLVQLHATKDSAEQTKKYLAGLEPVKEKKRGRPRKLQKDPLVLLGDEEEEFLEDLNDPVDNVDFDSDRGLTRWLSDSYTHAPDPFGYSEIELEEIISRNFSDDFEEDAYSEYGFEDVFTEAVENAHIGPTEDTDEYASCWCGREFRGYLGCPLARLI